MSLLLVAFGMLIYQSHTAFKLIMNPPMIMTTSEANISDVRKPLMYLCPSDQYDLNKTIEHGYAHNHDLVNGKMNATERSWGAHLNMTWEQLIRNVTTKSPEEFVNNTKFINDETLDIKLYPQFGFCFEVHYSLKKIVSLPGDELFQQAITFLLTDQQTKSYYRVDSTTQSGAIIYLEKNSQHSYIVDIAMHELRETSNCNSDPDYSYERCVDDYVTNDFITKLGCIPPLLADHDHCGIVPKEKLHDLRHYFDEYSRPYMVNVPTLAEEKCLKPCKQQKIHLTLKDKAPTIGGYGSLVSFAFNSKVKILKEQENYDWFNFIIDIGSSLVTWAGLSAVSLIDIGLNPIANIKSLFLLK